MRSLVDDVIDGCVYAVGNHILILFATWTTSSSTSSASEHFCSLTAL
jgi:hypothetical protein